MVGRGVEKKRRARSRAGRLQIAGRAADRRIAQALRGQEPAEEDDPFPVRDVDVEF